MKIMFSQCGRTKFVVLIKLENVIYFFLALHLFLILASKPV